MGSPSAVVADDKASLLELIDIHKRYGNTQALAGVNLTVGPGEIVGLVGHNGAGKSTLVRVICGQTIPDSGTMKLSGSPFPMSGDLKAARAHGIQIAFQELSLASTVRVFESVLIARPQFSEWNWRKHASAAISSSLDDIFPGHRISPTDVIENLSLAQKQMVEIALAAMEDIVPLSLLILDEPTSALGHEQAGNLHKYIHRLSDRGIATILISHRMAEILSETSRTVVLRDGHVAAEQNTNTLDSDSIVAIMSSEGRLALAEKTTREIAEDAPLVLAVSSLSTSKVSDIDLTVKRGEIVGIAGLDGQGQQALLHALYRGRRGTRSVDSTGAMSFVTGDRQNGGVFSLWSTAENIGIGIAAEYSTLGVSNGRKEFAAVGEWMKRLAVRGTRNAPILDLSGGNQQKVLVARALAKPSALVLLDDPFRGVDVETRRQLYARIREETASGRGFLWFTTENAELSECDRVLVMSHGRIVAELVGNEITEERVIGASFLVERVEL